MSQTIDNRVVEMRFENEQFERGVSSSISSLDKLKESLNFDESEKSLNSLNRSLNDVDASGLEKNIDEAGRHFSAFEIAAITAIANISSRLTDLGIQLAKSMSVDQVVSGFGKYEQELRSVQTIMNATGKSIEVVQDELEKLGWYTDETSYEYSAMVDNISKFTSQGIDLHEATSAMQGIANMAGLAGATVEDASHAMDGFSKAMAAGDMKLQNWKWIQTAHMETVQTKEAFMEAAVAAKTLTKVSDGVYKTLKGDTVTVATFTETLKDGWLNAEAMKKTFLEFSSYSNLVYAFQENFENLTHSEITTSKAIEMLSADFADNADVQKAYMDAVNETTGRTINMKEAQEELANWTENAAEKAFKASQEYRTFGDAIDATKDAASSGWKNIFSYIFGNAEESKELWGLVGDTLYDVFVEPLNSVTEMLGEWSDGGGFDTILTMVENLFTMLGSVFGPVKDALSELFPMLSGEEFYDITYRLGEFFDAMTLSEEAAGDLTETLTTLLKPLRWVADAFSFIFKVGASAVVILRALILTLVEMFGSGEKIKEFFKNLIGEENFNKLADAFTKAVESIKTAFGVLKTAIVGEGETVQFTDILSKALTVLVNIVSIAATALAKGLTFAIEQFNKLDLTKIAEGIGKGVNFLKGVLETGISYVFKAADGIASAVGTLLKWLDVKKLTAILLALGLLTSVVKTILFFKNIGEAIDNITSAFYDLGEAAKFSALSKMFFGIAAALLALAGGLAILAHCDWKSLILSTAILIALGYAIYEMVDHMRKIDTKDLLKVSMAMLAFGISVDLFVVAIAALIPVLAALTVIEWETLGKLGAILLGFTGVMAIIGNFASTFAKGAGAFAVMSLSLMLFAAGLTALVPSLLAMSLIKWESLAKAGGILVTLALVVVALGAAGPMALIGAGALLLLSVAMVTFATSLLQIAAASAIFVGLIKILSDLGPAAETATQSLITILMMVIQVIPYIGEALGKAFTMFIAGIVSGGAKIVEAISLVITGILQGIANNIQTIVDLVVSIITAVIEGIQANIPNIIACLEMIVDAVISFLSTKLPVLIVVLVDNVALLVDSIIQAIATEAPRLVTALLTALDQILASLVEFIPHVVEFAFLVIAGFIIGLSSGAILLVEAAAQALVDFLTGLAQAIRVYAPQIKAAGKDVISAFKEAILGEISLGGLAKTGLSAVWSFITGANAGQQDVYQAGVNSAGAFTAGASGAEYDPYDVGVWFNDSLVAGIEDTTDAAYNAGEGVGEALEDGLRDETDIHSKSPKIAGIGNWFGVSLTDGVDETTGLANDSGFGLGGSLSGGLLESLGIGLENADGMLNDFIANAASKMGGLEFIWGKSKKGANTWLVNQNEFLDYAYDGITPPGYKPPSDDDDKKPKIPGGGGGGGSGKGGGSGSEQKEKEKSIKELIQTYQFGQDVVDEFNKKYSDSINIFNEQVSGVDIARKSVDELALRLYKMSDQYQADLTNSDLKTEEVLEHIKKSFEDQMGKIKTSISNVDIWSEFKENEDPVTMDDLIENSDNWLNAIEDWQADLNQLLENGNLSDAMKQYLINLGFEGRDMIHALSEASEDELDSYTSNFDRFLQLQDSIPQNVMATWSGAMTGIQDVVENGAQAVINTLNTTLGEGLDPESGTSNALLNAQNIFSVYRDELERGAEDIKTDSYPVGLNLCEGIAEGIREGKYIVFDAVDEMTEESIERAEDAYDENSPSKVFARIGKFLDLGLAKGIFDYKGKVLDATDDLTNETIGSVGSSIQSISDLLFTDIQDPIIKPILDLSDIQAKAGQLNTFLEDTRVKATIQNEGEMEDSEKGVTYSFTQNNYSPKALSRIDIYRQTRNQFSMMKEATRK